VVHRSELRTVLRGKVLVLKLIGSGLEMVLARRLHLHRRGMRLNPRAAVEADMVRVDDRVLRNNGPILVDVRYVHSSEIRHRAVVSENPAAPFAADKADSSVAESIVDPAIEADMRTPVSRVPSVNAPAKSPIPGSPKQTSLRGPHPDTGNPEVTGISISPVTGSPNKTWCRQWRLHVNRQRGRSNIDRNQNAGPRLRRRQAKHRYHYSSSNQHIANSGTNGHEVSPCAVYKRWTVSLQASRIIRARF